MTHKFGKTFPDKLGEVTTLTGMPIDTNAAAYPQRIKRTFAKVFNGKSFDDKYWKILMDMISNPNKKFGLVAIDGYYTDVIGKDDIALVFNMGVPKLRGRRVYYLDKIYVRVGNTQQLKFYNSLLDIDDESHFTFAQKVDAWHPHISHGEPCLGSYSNELVKWKSEGNPIMYLKVIEQYLNTWNVRSPFWDLNRAQLDYESKGGKIYKSSKVINALRLLDLPDTKAARHFIYKNIDNIDTGSVANDIWCVTRIFDEMNIIRASLRDSFITKVSRGLKFYLNNHDLERRKAREDNSRQENSILTSNTRIMIPRSNTSNGITQTSFNRVNISNNLINDNDYMRKRQLLHVLSGLLSYTYKWIRSEEPIEGIFEDEDYIFNMLCKYYFPLLSKNNKYYDKMTKSGLYPHRVTQDSAENSDSNKKLYYKKHKLVSKIISRRERIIRASKAFFMRRISKKSVILSINHYIKSFEYYELGKISGHPDNKGNIHYHLRFGNSELPRGSRFFQDMGIYDTQHERYEEMVLFIDEVKPFDSLENLIDTVEKLKTELVVVETNSLISEYDKIIRRLRSYGHKTNHTEEDTQQIHLSFE